MPNFLARPLFLPTSRLLMCSILVACCAAGCGINPELTSEQQDRDLNARMAWVDKAIQVAERHNLAYRVEVESTGKPSIGETIDLYMNTGVSAKVMMFGNAASAPPNDEAPNKMVVTNAASNAEPANDIEDGSSDATGESGE